MNKHWHSKLAESNLNIKYLHGNKEVSLKHRLLSARIDYKTFPEFSYVINNFPHDSNFVSSE